MQTLGAPRVSVPTCRGRPSQPVHARPRSVCSRAIADVEASTSGSGIRVSVTKALKEWAPTVEAIGHGEQMVLFRKGGIKEPTFRPEAPAFLLFPTSFHTDQQLLKPGVAERYAAAMSLEPKNETVLQLPYVTEVTGAWTTYDPAVLPALSEHHVWTEQFIETRLKWRAKQPITVLELRCWRLRQPLGLRVADSMFGCFSWVDLSDQVPADLTAGATPVVEPSVFAARQQRLRAALGAIQTEPLSVEQGV